jgi:hypothetical protein
MMETKTLQPAVGAQVQQVVRRWDRRLWGVEFTGSRSDDAPMLIGRIWATEWASSTPYPGEPTRALLFTTRALARQWCAETMANWRDGRNDCVSRWRVRAVRVRETVQVEAPNVL